jgi:adenine-specific DNA-methyltransferase
MDAENPEYLESQLITCLGNKRGLLDFIGEGLEMVHEATGEDRLVCYDVFSGSGVVARYFKRHASFIYAGDLEEYSRIINLCYLTDASRFPEAAYRFEAARLARLLETDGQKSGFISELYAPADDSAIREGERAFFTTRNARFIDTYRSLLDETPEALRPFFVAPLLSEVSIHANTAGVFKGFYKDRSTGIGRFGGEKGDALYRITGDIEARRPVFSRFACGSLVIQGDALASASSIPPVDVAYLDPPYNQHPYGSNYFMLNLVANYARPEKISEVSGIPEDWKRSGYNSRRRALACLRALVARLRARFVLVSFNSEGFIAREEMELMLSRHGRVRMIEKSYNAFKGSRNLAARPRHVKEYLFILEKA